MMLVERRFQFSAVTENVPGACDFVVDAARAAGLDDRAAHHCRLAVDEACTNVIEHGFAQASSDHIIEVVCHYDDSQFVITINDDAPYFDPTTLPDPKPLRDIDQLEPGGWGIYFIKKLMDGVQYERAYDHNILTITKLIPPRTITPSETPTIMLPMPIHVSHPHPKISLIAPNGKIDSETTKQVERILLDQLAEGRKALILFLTNVDYMNSTGMKMLVGVWQRARDAKSDLILCGVQPSVREMLHIIGLDLVFMIVPTVDDALNAVKFKK